MTKIFEEMEPEEKLRDIQRRSFYSGMNISRRYWDKTLDNYDNEEMKKQALVIIKADKSLILSGPCGTGKTHLAIGLMKMIKKETDIIPSFLSASELFLEIKDGFDKKISEYDIVEKYAYKPFLVLDDLGVEKVSDWSRSVFYNLIDKRYRNMKQTIITTNLTIKEISEKIDDRIASRLCEMGAIISLGGDDRRLEIKQIEG